jgi:hypothetical protein
MFFTSAEVQPVLTKRPDKASDLRTIAGKKSQEGGLADDVIHRNEVPFFGTTIRQSI